MKIGRKSFFLFQDFKNQEKIQKICVFTSIRKHIHRPTIQYGKDVVVDELDKLKIDEESYNQAISKVKNI